MIKNKFVINLVLLRELGFIKEGTNHNGSIILSAHNNKINAVLTNDVVIIFNHTFKRTDIESFVEYYNNLVNFIYIT